MTSILANKRVRVCGGGEHASSPDEAHRAPPQSSGIGIFQSPSPASSSQASVHSSIINSHPAPAVLVELEDPEDEQEEEEVQHQLQRRPQRPAPTAPSTGLLVRPVARTVAEIFYEEARQMGLDASQVHVAAAHALNWERKWASCRNAQQPEEFGYADEDPEHRGLPGHYASDYERFVRDREELSGARNPGPEDEYDEDCDYDDFEMEDHEDEGSYYDFEEEFASMNNKRGRCCDDEEDEELAGSEDDEEEVDDIVPVPVEAPPAQLVRPTPVRVVVPAEGDEESAEGDVPIPSSIAGGRDLISNRSNASSPLTVDGSSDGDEEESACPSEDAAAAAAFVEADCDDSSTQQLSQRQRGSFELPPGVLRPVPLSGIFDWEVRAQQVAEARDGLLRSLAAAGGDAAEAGSFDACLSVLSDSYAERCEHQERTDAAADGMWLMLTKPTFFGQLGVNGSGDPLYTLGRMTFDMFTPSNLVCSLQGNFNSVGEVDDLDFGGCSSGGAAVPKSLRDEVQADSSMLRTYNVVTAFTIEPPLPEYPNAPNRDVRRPIRGVMTTYGYTLPDPDSPNRQSIWITGGRIEPNDDEADLKAWRELFALHPPNKNRGVAERAKLLAVKVLMGAVLPSGELAEDGSMEYKFTRPIGGHGVAYVETLFMDSTLRVVRGHRGTTFVSTRLSPESRNHKNEEE